MSYNKAKEEYKWKRWKEKEETVPRIRQTRRAKRHGQQ